MRSLRLPLLVLALACGSETSRAAHVLAARSPSATAAPTARIVFDSTSPSGPAPLYEQLDGTSSLCPNWCADYAWNFGDGSPISHEGWDAHTYASNGSYTLTLTVTDQSGSVDTATATVTAGSGGPPPPPPPPPPPTGDVQAKIVFDGTAPSGPAPLLEQFDATLSQCTSNGCADYQWDFGDGTPTVPADWVSHTFASDGSYLVTLTVTGASGATGMATATVTVGSGAPPPPPPPPDSTGDWPFYRHDCREAATPRAR